MRLSFDSNASDFKMLTVSCLTNAGRIRLSYHPLLVNVKDIGCHDAYNRTLLDLIDGLFEAHRGCHAARI